MATLYTYRQFRLSGTASHVSIAMGNFCRLWDHCSKLWAKRHVEHVVALACSLLVDLKKSWLNLTSRRHGTNKCIYFVIPTSGRGGHVCEDACGQAIHVLHQSKSRKRDHTCPLFCVYVIVSATETPLFKVSRTAVLLRQTSGG